MNTDMDNLLATQADMMQCVKAEPGLRAIVYGNRLSISEDEAEQLLKNLAFAGSVVTRTLATGRHFFPKPE